MVFNTTFNNISVISWRSVLLVEETNYKAITICVGSASFIIFITIKSNQM